MRIIINADQLAEITRLLVGAVVTERTVDLASSYIDKIECIKRVRRVTGLGLKEAKDLVEAALPHHDPVAHVARQICDM